MHVCSGAFECVLVVGIGACIAEWHWQVIVRYWASLMLQKTQAHIILCITSPSQDSLCFVLARRAALLLDPPSRYEQVVSENN